MSSTLLYLAIVAVWACVLVPMWLRRDTDANAFSRLLNRRSGTGDEYHADGAADLEPVGARDGSRPYEAAAPRDTTAHYAEFLDDEAGVQARRGVRRATVIARRRRRTFLLVLAMLAAGVAAGAGVGPWWVALPPAGLMLGHLALLRVAADIDAARRHERLQVRARAEERMAEDERMAEEAARAEIIDLAERARARDVFDQYAEDVARAVGD